MIAPVAGAASRVATNQARKFVENPVDYFIRASRSIGVGMLVGGAALGVAAYYMKASATAAANNELNVLQNIGTIFSNIKSPGFTPAPSGSAPLSFTAQGVQNFFSDSWNDVQAAGADIAQIGAVLGTLGEDVGTGLADVTKAFLAFVMHFPDILWNGLVWGIGGAIADVFTWAFPWLMLIGGALVIASIVAWAVRGVVNAYVTRPFREAWSEKQIELQERGAVRWRRLLGVRGASPRPHRSSEPAPAAPGPAAPANAYRQAPEAVPDQTNATGAVYDSLPEGKERPGEPSGVSTAEKPLPAVTPTSEVEEQLGNADGRDLTPEEIREAEANRVASLPGG